MTIRLSLIAALLISTGCSGMSKLDYGRLASRDGWQLPSRVVDALSISPGQQIADLGAGDGYFTFRLADAVGPEGLVFAVEVDEEKLEALENEVRERGVLNVRVVRGILDDPRLPDHAIDLVLIVNTFHHIDERETYFSNLRRDLAPGGRVANIDMRDDLTGILSLFPTDGHWTAAEDLVLEMERAGYQLLEQYDFLPLQSFGVYASGTEEGRPQ